MRTSPVALVHLFLLSLAAASAQITHPPFPKIDNAAGYKVDAAWPTEKPPGVEWNAAMSSVAVAPDGNIWTLNRGTTPVQVYSPQGKFLQAWDPKTHPATTFKNAHTVRFDPNGGLWLIDTLAQTVRKFSESGEVLMTLGTPGQAGEDASHLNQPNDVAFAPNGEIAVSDGYGNDRIVVFDAHGKFLRAWGKLGQGPGEFSQPHGVAYDNRGRLYVADRNNSRIQVFDGQGKFLSAWSNLVTPWYIVIQRDPGGAEAVYVIGSSPMLWSESAGTYLATPPKDQMLLKFDTTGRLLAQWGFPKGDKPGELNWAHGLAMAPDGTIYVAEVQGKRVQKFVPVGAR